MYTELRLNIINIMLPVTLKIDVVSPSVRNSHNYLYALYKNYVIYYKGFPNWRH